MKKNGVFCIAIAVALLVGGVAAASASVQTATITPTQYAAQIDINTVATSIGGSVGNGNSQVQVINDIWDFNVLLQGQISLIGQMGDYNF
ncbi:MAG: hypothetical protein KAT65_10040 [Methanophagales archaeon]|nr:hypothetical protein [Methanophagales archaeon]